MTQFFEENPGWVFGLSLAVIVVTFMVTIGAQSSPSSSSNHNQSGQIALLRQLEDTNTLGRWLAVTGSGTLDNILRNISGR